VYVCSMLVIVTHTHSYAAYYALLTYYGATRYTLCYTYTRAYIQALPTHLMPPDPLPPQPLHASSLGWTFCCEAVLFSQWMASCTMSAEGGGWALARKFSQAVTRKRVMKGRLCVCVHMYVCVCVTVHVHFCEF
jgi:hypothetical protein